MANYKSDEEYHFSEAEAPVSYTTGSNQPGKDKDFQGRKKTRAIILLVAILMAGWAIYKFMGVFLSQIKQVSPKAATSVPQPPMPAQPSRPLPPTLSAAQMQEISDQKARLNKLESEIINLQTTLSDTNTKLGDVTNQISNLASQVNKPPPVVEVRKPAPVKKPLAMRKRESRSPYYSYRYRLEAAIPGRAWIMRNDGTNITVSPGDKIPNYGTVVGIDPNAGVVQMSSGASIKYRYTSQE